MRTTKSSRSRDLITSSTRAVHEERINELRAKGLDLTYDDEVWINRRQAIKEIQVLIAANAELENRRDSLLASIEELNRKVALVEGKEIPKASR